MVINSKKALSERMAEFYKKMLFYRRFEEKVNQAYMGQKFSGFCHLHIGQEAVCVGIQACLTSLDYMISSYRSHTQAIAKGIDAKFVFAELLGKRSGCSKGKGGSMHMFSKENRFLGGHGIVGGQAPIAVGVGFSIKYRKEKNFIVCYLGDAAMNQGVVFEAMNMAMIWSLPVLFVVENNQYGMGTDIKRVTSVDKLYRRACAFQMECSEVDGMNVLSVYQHVSEIASLMRHHPKPHLLEVHTYRYKGHSVSDPGKYRSKDEVLKYKERDPIVSLRKLLIEKQQVSKDTLTNWDQEIKNQVIAAEKFAESSKEPDEEDAFADVFSK